MCSSQISSLHRLESRPWTKAALWTEACPTEQGWRMVVHMGVGDTGLSGPERKCELQGPFAVT